MDLDSRGTSDQVQLGNLRKHVLSTAVDVWTTKPFQVGIDSFVVERVYPQQSISINNQSSQIEFKLGGKPGQLIDLNDIRIETSFKVVKVDGSALDDSTGTKPEEYGVINYVNGSLWKQIDVLLNDVQISDASPNYAYRAYLDTLLHTTKDEQVSTLSAAGFYRDSVGEQAGDVKNFEQQNFPVTRVPATNGSNPGAEKRNQLYVSKDGDVKVFGRIHSDLFQQMRYLIANVDLRILLRRQSDSFIMMSKVATASTAVRLEITGVTLHVKTLTPSADLFDSMEKRLLAGNYARYPITRTIVKDHFIPKGVLNYQIANLATGFMPKRMVVGFVSPSAFGGNFKESPFNFQAFNLTKVEMLLGNRRLPFTPWNIQVKGTETTSGPITTLNVRPYYECMEALKFSTQEKPHINLFEWTDGYRLYGFDFTKTGDAMAAMDTVAGGNLNLNLQFKTATPVTGYQAIFYMMYDNEIAITQPRHIVTDFNN